MHIAAIKVKRGFSPLPISISFKSKLEFKNYAKDPDTCYETLVTFNYVLESEFD